MISFLVILVCYFFSYFSEFLFLFLVCLNFVFHVDSLDVSDLYKTFTLQMLSEISIIKVEC